MSVNDGQQIKKAERHEKPLIAFKLWNSNEQKIKESAMTQLRITTDNNLICWESELRKSWTAMLHRIWIAFYSNEFEK